MGVRQPPEVVLLDTVEHYFALLQAHVARERMTAEVLTDDFETGFVDGLMWRGPEGLAAFLEARSVFFDETHEVLQVMDATWTGDDAVEARTRLAFFLRSHDVGAPVGKEFRGQAFHTWRLRRVDGQWRVAAQIVDGFAMLDANSAELFGAPAEGLRT